MLVDFMLIGAQKCGTTSLASQLASHPKVCFCRTKEPGYFNENSEWRAGLDDYHALYEPEPGQICGEASTMYTFLPTYLGTHQRLFEYNPTLKLIYIMRNPVDRIISHYTHNLVRDLEKRPPEIAVFDDSRYINWSRYAVQIRPYIELFGRGQILFLVFEDYIRDQTNSMLELAEFLKIDATPFLASEYVQEHRSVGEHYLKSRSVEQFVRSSWFQSVREHVPASVRQPIRRYFSNKLDERPHFSVELQRELWRWLEDDVRALEKLVGRSLEFWREGGS